MGYYPPETDGAKGSMGRDSPHNGALARDGISR